MHKEKKKITVIYKITSPTGILRKNKNITT